MRPWLLEDASGSVHFFSGMNAGGQQALRIQDHSLAPGPLGICFVERLI
jgi:hypothetical protein